ncbi:NUDIX domain-containing protein [uncultured Paracoccus sp.]|uniref:NUDIX domain-containing protein n=1 Tax=Paracoccus sp. S1E-3 TaxID=2756130 RepID=UPI001C68FD6E|nr:NUDIX domain-containing protein [uncultured Paracoccus sp.]
MTRRVDGQWLVLAFIHPLAGRQFVKGGIERHETPAKAAIRELSEESGIRVMAPPVLLGTAPIGSEGRIWHFFDCPAPALPDRWQHRTEDRGGLLFDFFWHPLAKTPGQDWHPIFRDAHVTIRRLLDGR